jgi:hypothetical protein
MPATTRRFDWPLSDFSRTSDGSSRIRLVEGFVYEGQRVPLMDPKGICKPRVLRQIPVSIT